MQYNREKAVEYAHKWAFHRNPNYANFDAMGGDCTNFVSQCLYAGGTTMNPTPTTGWFYYTLNHRAPAWTGVEELYRFLTGEHKLGPVAADVPLEEVILGDIVQLATSNGRFHHAGIVVSTDDIPTLENTLIACHTFDSDYRPLATYNLRKIRFLHIVST